MANKKIIFLILSFKGNEIFCELAENLRLLAHILHEYYAVMNEKYCPTPSPQPSPFKSEGAKNSFSPGGRGVG